jgi:hypothetical protein
MRQRLFRLDLPHAIVNRPKIIGDRFCRFFFPHKAALRSARRPLPDAISSPQQQ